MTIQIVIIMIILLLRTGKEKEIRPIRLLIGPLILLGTLSYSFTQHIEITAMSLLAMIVFALAGFAIGLWRGKLYKVTYDQQSGRITAASSLYGTLFHRNHPYPDDSRFNCTGWRSFPDHFRKWPDIPSNRQYDRLTFYSFKRYMNIKASAAIN